MIKKSRNTNKKRRVQKYKEINETGSEARERHFFFREVPAAADFDFFGRDFEVCDDFFFDSCKIISRIDKLEQ